MAVPSHPSARAPDLYSLVRRRYEPRRPALEEEATGIAGGRTGALRGRPRGATPRRRVIPGGPPATWKPEFRTPPSASSSKPAFFLERNRPRAVSPFGFLGRRSSRPEARGLKDQERGRNDLGAPHRGIHGNPGRAGCPGQGTT